MTHDEVLKMHAYYMAGHSLEETGAQFAYSWSAIQKSFKQHGLYIRSASESAYLLQARKRAQRMGRRGAERES